MERGLDVERGAREGERLGAEGRASPAIDGVAVGRREEGGIGVQASLADRSRSPAR